MLHLPIPSVFLTLPLSYSLAEDKMLLEVLKLANAILTDGNLLAQRSIILYLQKSHEKDNLMGGLHRQVDRAESRGTEHRAERDVVRETNT